MKIKRNIKTYNEEKKDIINEESVLSKGNPELIRKKYESCPLCSSKDIYVYKSFDCTSHPLYKEALENNILWMNCKKCNTNLLKAIFRC